MVSCELKACRQTITFIILHYNTLKLNYIIKVYITTEIKKNIPEGIIFYYDVNTAERSK